MTDSPLTDQQLAEYEALVGAATAGPWLANGRVGIVTDAMGSPLAVFGGGVQDHADAAFTAAARTVVPALVAEVHRLRAELPKPVIVPSKDTPLSEYDFVELVAFAQKVESEGFGYAFEEYPPHFEAPELAPVADDYSLLRRLYAGREDALDEFWTRPDAEDVYDVHIDEARRRRREARAADAAAVEPGE